jgi:hypothetical protein
MLIVALIISLILVALSIVRYKKVFNPFTIEVYFTIFFLILPQLLIITDLTPERHFYSDLVIIIYVLSIFLGTLLNVNSFKLRSLENVGTINKLNILLYVALIMPMIPLFLEGGISAQGFRRFYETVVFSKYASFFELSKLVLYFIIFFKLINRQKFSPGFFILFPLVFFYGSRFVILDFIIYLCVFLEQFKNLGIKSIITTCLIGALFIITYTYFQFSSRSNLTEHLTSYFDIYKNQSYVINKFIDGDIPYYYGELYFSSYLKFIPRIFWEDKPKDFGFAILNYAIFPESAAKGYMPSFGLGSLFADFGFFSVIMTGFLSGFIKNFFYRILQKSKNNLSFFLFVFPFGMITNFFLIIYLSLDYLLRLLSKRPENTKELLPDN